MAATIIKVFNTEGNFWEMNPAFTSIEIFRNFNNRDKSKGRENSSRIMWAIALLLDPNDYNPWRNINIEDKKKLIVEEFIKDNKFKWGDYQPLLEAYEERVLTVGERELIRIERKLHQRAKFIDETDYKLDYYEETEGGKFKLIKGTAEQLDKMMINTSKIYQQYNEVKDMLAKEQSEGNMRGGAKESASERGVL